MKRAAFLLLLVAPLLAVGAPVPKDTTREKIERAYGKIVDSKGDSKFGLDGDKLTITLPAGEVRDLTDKIDTAPRLVREVKGDFVLTVRVSVPLDENAEVAKEMDQKGDVPLLGCGVRFKFEDGTWAQFGFARWRDPSGVLTGGCPSRLSKSFIRDRFGIGGNGLLYEDERSKLRTLSIRYTRRGKSVKCTYSTDSENYSGGSESGTLPETDDVVISLFASHGSSKAHTVTFDQFSVEPLKAEAKK